MKKLFDLIKADLITMNGGKSSLKTTAVFVIVFYVFTGFCVSPIMGMLCPLLIGAFFVPMLFGNEIKFRCGRLWSILPVSRSDLVNSRFALVLGLYTAVSILFYLLMLISLFFKPYYILWGEDAESMDIIELMVKSSGGLLTEFGLFNMVYFIGFSVGMIIAAGSLRNYFKNPEGSDMSLSLGKSAKVDKSAAFGGLIIMAILTVMALTVGGVLPFGTAASVIIQLFSQLAQAANGFLLGAVFVTVAVFTAAYKYICTVLEYEEMEL